jgi:5-methylcytosine-specific restriction endonuclease McrA
MAKTRRKNLSRQKESLAFEAFSGDEQDKRREKNLARDLRRTRWWKEKLAQGICHYCKGTFAPEELTMDHVVPLAQGGKSVKQNLVCACKNCNTEKSYQYSMDFENSRQEEQGPDPDQDENS